MSSFKVDTNQTNLCSRTFIRLPITRAFNGNWKRVRVIGAENKELEMRENGVYCFNILTVCILIEVFWIEVEWKWNTKLLLKSESNVKWLLQNKLNVLNHSTLFWFVVWWQTWFDAGRKLSEGRRKLPRVSGGSRNRVTEGKTAINVWRKSKWNWFWFKLARVRFIGNRLYCILILLSSANRSNHYPRVLREIYPTLWL